MFQDLQAETTVGISVAVAAQAVLGMFMAARTKIKAFGVADATNVMGDDLKGIEVSTGVKAGDTPEVMASRLQVQAKYFFNGG